MTTVTALHPLLSLIVAVMILTGSAITLTGTIGLLRLRTFYERVHAPTLGTTAGTGCIVVASIIFFSATDMQPALRASLILLLITVTTPITLLLLIRAAVRRDSRNSE
jgi:multicomponent K+:H+ antiporter subunit G